MGDKTKIEWTDATWPRSDASGTKTYRRSDPSRGPGSRLRRHMARLGLRWCRGCASWLPAVLVTKNGLCRPHERIDYRARYAADPVAIRARVHARKRGIDPVPAEAALVAELFDGLCAYCPAPGDTWDHVVPVAAGGRTEPGNIVPACGPCNSSKKDRELLAWLDSTGRVPHPMLHEYLLLVEEVAA